MFQKKLYFLSFLAGTFFSTISYSQLVINNTNPNNSGTYLVQNILMGSGVTAFNVTYTGDSTAPANQIGFFNGVNSNLGLDSGIVLATGDVRSIAPFGPNGNINGQNNEDDLLTIANLVPPVVCGGCFTVSSINDKSILEFDFIPIGDSVEFNYVFGSDEYLTWINSAFNDVFAFFISGPGITGPYVSPPGFPNGAMNIAGVPNTSPLLPITVSSVNPNTNSQYYIDNPANATVALNGFTTVLTAKAIVQCGKTYHIKLAIADGTDNSLISAVFLQAKSFTSPGIQVSLNTVLGDNNMNEGCADAYINFTRVDTDSVQIVHFEITGTATNGVDYVQIPDSIVFPSGEDSAQITVSLLNDGIPEGVESIIITVYNIIPCTGDTVIETATLTINEGYDLTMFSVDDTVTCALDPVSISATASDGSPPYSYSWGNGMSGSPITVSPSVTDSFIVTASDLIGCKGLDTVVVTVLHPLPVIAAGNDSSLCIGNSIQVGGSPAGPAGAVFAWSPSATLSDTTLANPTATPTTTTTYVVTVTDTNTCQNKDTIVITVYDLPVADAGNDTILCPGNSVQTGGSPTGPAGSSFNWSPSGTLNNSTLANPTATPAANTDYIVTVTDTNNCVNNDTVSVSLYTPPVALAGNDTAICTGDSIQLIATGGISYAWSPVSGLSSAVEDTVMAGPVITTTYIVTVTDNNNCIDTESVNITVNALPVVNAGNDISICAGDTIQVGGSPTGPAGSTYNWLPNTDISSTTAANPDVFPASTITYYITVTDVNACASDDSILVTVNNLPVVDAGNDTTICTGSSVQVGGSPTGPVGSVFNWLPSGTLNNSSLSNPTATPAADTDYIVTVTDGNSCINSDTISISLFALPVAVTNNDTAICAGDTITLIASGGASYNWTPASGLSSTVEDTVSAGPVFTTTYLLTVTDNNNCSDTESIVITVNNLPVVDAGNDTAICIGDTIQAGGTPTSSTGISFTWSPNTNISSTAIPDPDVYPVSTITYTVIVTDGNSCVNSDSLLVAVNNLPMADAGMDTTICDGVPVVIGGNPTGPLNSTFDWSPATSLSSTTSANPTATPSSDITYTVVVTDTNNCINSDSVQFVVNPNPVAEAGPGGTLCVNDSLQLNGSGGGGSYEWIPGDSLTNPNISNPVAFPADTTTFYLIVTDGNNCKDTDLVVVNVNQLPPADAGPDLWVCPNDSVMITASGGIIYSWSPSAGLSATNISNPMASPADTTEYFVTVTDANGCVNVDSMTLDMGPVVPTDAGPDKQICIFDTTQIGGSPTAPPGSTFSWNTSSGLSDTAIANPQAFPQDTTLYYVTSANFTCTGLDSVLVIVNPLPVIDAGTDISICIFDSTQLNAAGGVSYAWTPADSLSDDSIANPFAFPSDTTEYLVTAIDINGCENIDSVTIIVNPLPVIIISNDIEICIYDSTQLNASGGISYAWAPADSLTNDSISNPVAFPSDTTMYSVTVTDGNTCVNTDSVLVIVNPLPVAVASATDTAICIGDTTQLNATGGDNYSWLPADSLNNSTISNPFAFPSDTTIYVVTVVDSNSCVNKDSITITVNPLPDVDAGPDAAICIYDSTQLNASGGISYVWAPADSLTDDSISNPMAFPSDTTIYYVTGTDNNGCINSDSVNIIVNALPVVTATAAAAEICIGDSTLLTASGGIIYAWLPPDSLTDDSISNPVAFPSDTTMYIVTVTDGNNCVNTDSVTVTVNPLPVISITGNFTICFGDTTQLNASGGDNYSWSPADSLDNPDISDPLAFPADTTEYVVTVTDSNSCVHSDSVTIIVNFLPIVDAGADDTICIGDTAQLNATGATTYAWNPTDSLSDANMANPLAFPSDTTIYFVTGTDDNGCVNSDSVRILVNPLPVADATAAAGEICLGDSVQLSATGGISFSWLPEDSLTDPLIPDPIAFPSDTTTYVVTVTDANNCVNTDSVTVEVNPLPSDILGNDLELCIGDSIQLNAAGGDSYSWFPADSLDNPDIANPLAFPSDTTMYIVTVIDSNGCTNSDSITVAVNLLPVVDAGPDDTMCFGDSVQLNAGGALNYLWIPAASLSNANAADPFAFPAGNTMYLVTGTDTNICSNTDSVFVLVNPLPAASINGGADSVTACNGDSVQLNAAGGPALAGYLWYPATGLNNTTISNPVATISGSLEYFVSVTDSNACSNVDSITVGIFNSPAIDAGAGDTLCAGDTIQLNASGGNSYSWSPASGLNNPAIFNPFAYPLVSTEYFVSGLDSNGCTGIDSVSIVVNALPNVDAGNNDSLCLGDSLQLNASGAVIYLWSPAAGLSNSTIANPLAYPSGSIEYFLTGTDSNNCVNTDSITITVNPLPVADAGNDTASCSGAGIQLNASGGTNYLWSPSAGLSNVNIPNPVATLAGDSIKYYVTVTSANGCQDIDSIIVKTFSITISPDTSVCSGDSASLSVNAVSGYLPYTYLWSPGSGMSSVSIADPRAAPGSSVTYFVTVTENNGCSDAASVSITVNENPVADFSFTLEPSCVGAVASFENKSGEAGSYLWIFGNGETSTKENPEHLFLYNERMDVTLVAINSSGCDDSSSATQSIKSFDDYFDIVVPNVFTPDGDGKNDWFEIRFDNRLQECTDVKIFNRWGEMIFASSGNQHSWNGRTFAGEEAPPGTYFFVFDINGKETKGTVTLIR